jgi:hypothetical protein
MRVSQAAPAAERRRLAIETEMMNREITRPLEAIITYQTPLSPQQRSDKALADAEKKRLADLERKRRALAAAERELIRQSRLDPTEEEEDSVEDDYEYS